MFIIIVTQLTRWEMVDTVNPGRPKDVLVGWFGFKRISWLGFNLNILTWKPPNRLIYARIDDSLCFQSFWCNQIRNVIAIIDPLTVSLSIFHNFVLAKKEIKQQSSYVTYPVVSKYP